MPWLGSSALSVLAQSLLLTRQSVCSPTPLPHDTSVWPESIGECCFCSCAHLLGLLAQSCCQLGTRIVLFHQAHEHSKGAPEMTELYCVGMDPIFMCYLCTVRASL